MLAVEYVRYEINCFKKNVIFFTSFRMTDPLEFALIGSVDSGKCFKKGTNIMLADRNIKKVEDIKIGDKVLDINGNKVDIVSTHNGRDRLYIIKQKMGESYTVNRSHILSLMFANIKTIKWNQKRGQYIIKYVQDMKLKEKRFGKRSFDENRKIELYNEAKKFLETKEKEPGFNKNYDVTNISVTEYLKLPKKIKKILYGYRPQSLSFESKPITIDPYILGLWLGNDIPLESEIISGNPKVLEYIKLECIKEYAHQIGKEIVKHNQPVHLENSECMTDVKNWFSKTNLLANKNIPDNYLLNTQENRLSLLAGIIDTHGNPKGKTYEIVQKSKLLSDDTLFLARSLGFWARQTEIIKSYSQSDGTKVSGLYYKIIIIGDSIDEIPVRQKKKVVLLPHHKKQYRLSSLEIKTENIDDYYGFEIDNDSKLFLAPDFTVWHNSTLGGQLLHRAQYVDSRDLDKIFKKAEEDGMERWKWARILDIFEEEAARGKTHEFIKIDFEINDQSYILVDTPGHSIFIRSMIEGVYGVKIAGIIIPMPDNEFDAAFRGGVIKEHLIIARASGIEKVILLANKMDLVGWDQEEFDRKTKIVQQFLQKVGYGKNDVITIPVSAFNGIGLGISPSIDGGSIRDGLPDWYSGPTFFEALGSFAKEISFLKLSDATKTTNIGFSGNSFILDTRIVNYDSIITLGFDAILHIEGKEYVAELVGIKNGEQKFVKNGDKCFTIWTLEQAIETKNDKVLIRKGETTIGLGKIVKTVDLSKKRQS